MTDGGDTSACSVCPTESRQAVVLAKLEEIFLTEGYVALTMADIARRVRCSKRTLYELAPNRRALFLMVVRRWMARIREIGDAAAASIDDPGTRLSAYLRPAVTETGAASETFLADLLALPEARVELEAHQSARVKGLRAIIEEGVASGHFRPCSPHLVAELCLAGFERINDPEVRAASGLNFSQTYSQFYSILLGGIGNDRI